MKTTLLGLLLASALVCGSTAHAQIIAINFTGGAGSNGQIDTHTPTGAVTVYPDFWNELNGASGSQTGLIETDGTVDPAGSTVLSTTSITYSSEDPYLTNDHNLGNLLDGYLDGNGASENPPVANGHVTVTLTNIPFAVYDVYAYIAPYIGHSQSSASIGSETLSFATDDPADTSFTTNSDPNADHPIVNTLLFSGVTGSSFTFVENGNNNNTSVGLAGIEIVEVIPEPGTWAMMGLGALGLIWMVRRKAAVR